MIRDIVKKLEKEIEEAYDHWNILGSIGRISHPDIVEILTRNVRLALRQHDLMRSYIREIEELIEVNPGKNTKKGKRLKKLVKLVARYEHRFITYDE